MLHAINCIEVPVDMEDTALAVRNTYIDYFKMQSGFVSSTFYKASISLGAINYINIVVWESQSAYDAVVNEGFANVEGINSDGMKVLGKGFPEPIKVHPGVYEIIESN